LKHLQILYNYSNSLVFKSAPPTPPSELQAAELNNSNPIKSPKYYIKSVWSLLRTPQFILLLAAFGICQGVFYALLTHMENMILSEMPKIIPEENAVYIQTTFLAVGIIIPQSLLAWHLILQENISSNIKPNYKNLSIQNKLFIIVSQDFLRDDIHFGNTFCSNLFNFTRQLAKAANIFTLHGRGTIRVIIILCFFIKFHQKINFIPRMMLIGYVPVAFDFMAELTYPQSVATCAAVLTLGSQICALLFTLIYEAIYVQAGYLAANLTICGFLVIGAMLTAFNKPHFNNSQRAESNDALKIEHTTEL